MREKTAEERVADAERDVTELRALLDQARAVIARLEGYEPDLKWLRNERSKAR